MPALTDLRNQACIVGIGETDYTRGTPKSALELALDASLGAIEDARKLRDRWTHPKPPFDTWSLSLSDVYSAITVTRDLFIELSEMMDADPPLWLKPVDDVLDEIHREAG